MALGFGLGVALKPGGSVVVFWMRVGEVGDCGLLALIGPMLMLRTVLERNIRVLDCRMTGPLYQADVATFGLNHAQPKCQRVSDSWKKLPGQEYRTRYNLTFKSTTFPS